MMLVTQPMHCERWQLAFESRNERRNKLKHGRCECRHGVEMAKLNAAARKEVPTSEFGLPGSRKYPMPDRAHAANAKARATQMVDKGKLSASSAAKIRAKANRVLGK